MIIWQQLFRLSENMMAISMNKERCTELDVDFYFTSYSANRADDGFKFALEVIEKPYNGEEYTNYEEELFVAYSEQRGERTFYLLDDGYLYDTERWLEILQSSSSTDLFAPEIEEVHLKKTADPVTSDLLEALLSVRHQSFRHSFGSF